MLFGHHVLSAAHDGAVWRVRATDRATRTTAELGFDALVLTDKLLLLPNTYAVMPPADHGPLALPPALTSTGAVVMLIALQRSAATTAEGTPSSATAAVSTYPSHPCIARVVHESAKPGRDRTGGREQFVVHSSAAYAEAHLEGEGLDDEAAVLAEMQVAFLELGVAGTGSVLHASVMAWDHAQPAPGSRVLDAAYSIDPARRGNFDIILVHLTRVFQPSVPYRAV